MHCPQCNVALTTPGTHCPACNASLMQACPQCTFRNLLGQQFCGQCGADLTALPAIFGGVVKDAAGPGVVEDGLRQYPVLSVELMNLDELYQKLNNPDQVARIVRDLMLRLESQLTAQNARVDSLRDNVIFVSFNQEANLGQALSKALKVAIALAKKIITLQDMTLTIRVGMEVVSADSRGPMTGVAERQVAKPGQVVVGMQVYKLTASKVPYETIGPIAVQGEMRPFYLLLPEAPPPVPQPAEPVHSTTEPFVAQQETPVVTAPPEPLAPLPLSPSSEGVVAGMERKFEPEEKPGPIVYVPQEFVSQKNPAKKPNITYTQLVSTLESEFVELTQPESKRQGKIIAVCGPDGIGKTSILNMVRANLPQETLFWVGGSCLECTSGDRFPLYYWVELLQNLMGLPAEPIEKQQAQAHLDTVLKAMFGEDAYTADKVDFLSTVLGMTPIEPISGSTRQYLGRMIPQLYDILVHMAQVKPLVMILENLEYADAASLELLLQLLHLNLLSSNISILMTYTPDVVLTGPLQQVVMLMPFKEFVLDKADEEILVSIAEPPLGVPWKKLPDGFRGQLIDKGSPLFLEEAFRWLHMKGGFTVNAKTGKFNPEKKLKDLLVPEDVSEIIRERFETLEEPLKYILQIAASLGERFSANVLADLTQAPEQFEEILKHLWQNGFVVPDAGAMVRFRHHLVWQVVYRSMSEDVKSKSHHLITDYFVQARSKGFCIAPVYAAHQGILSLNPAVIVPTTQEVGAWFAQVGSATAANQAFQMMQQYMAGQPGASSPEFQKRLYESLGILNLDINPEYAKNLFLTARQLPVPESPAEALQVQLFLSQTYERLGAFPHAASTIHRTLEALPAGQNPLERLALGSQEVWYLYMQGKYQEALLVYSQEVEPAGSQTRQSPWNDPFLRAVYAQGQLAYARIALWQLNPALATQVIDESVTQCDLHNEQHLAIHFRLTRSLCLLLQGNTEHCQREMETVLEEVEKLPHPMDLMVWWGLIVLMHHCEMGDWQNASMLLPNTGYQAEQSRDYLAWCMCQALAGRISVETGSYGEAQKLLEQAVTVSAEHHLSHSAMMGWRYIAENELKADNLDVAEQICSRALEVAIKPHIQNHYERQQLNLTMARIYLKQKAYKQAGTLLEKNWPVIVKSGYTPLMAETAALISQLYGYLADEFPEPHKSKYRQQQQSFAEKARTLWLQQGNKYRLMQLDKTQGATLAT